MAIVVERKAKNINWFALAIGLFTLIFIAGVIFYLFISTPPGIEKIIAPIPEEKVIKGIKEITDSVDIKAVINEVNTLETPVPPPTTGDLGRINPFLPI